MAKAESARQTPMMRQYQEIKAEYPDVFLFYRMGDFYELFEQDAIEASRLLNITLTSRNKGEDAVPMAGVPVHSVKDYLKKLIALEKRVAICEQLEEPSQTKGLVKRGVVRIITPGTLTEDLDADASCHLLSVVPGRDQVYLAWCDLSTGEVGLNEVSRDQMNEALVSLNLQEMIYPEERQIEGDWPFDLCRPGWQFHVDEGKRLAAQIYGSPQASRMTDSWSQGLWSALGGLFHYLQETQREQINHLKFPELTPQELYLRMDTNTVRSLDLLENHRTGKKLHSLFWVLDCCQTSHGRRLLQQWITRPLLDLHSIRARQLAFEDLGNEAQARESIRKELACVSDIERLVGRLSLRRGGPRDLLALGQSLQVLDKISELWSSGWECDLLASLKKRLEPLTELSEKILHSLVEEPPKDLTEGGVIDQGVDSQLDQLRQARSQVHQWLANYQAQEIKSTNLSNLRVVHNRVFGYTIELPRREADKVPDRFRRQQTLKNTERYVTVELKEFETKLLSAKEQSLAREKEIYEDLLKMVLEFVPVLQERSKALAQLDVLTSLSTLAANKNWKLPQLAPDCQLHIEQGRHPVVEQVLETGEFIPNDLDFDQDRSLLLITGPNMAGKSTYIRQVALLVLLAQMGMPVPAQSMVWSPVDRLYTRIGAADELAQGQSTFMVEMAECAHILKSATERSLIILDEVGRGTSTLDGLAIARAIVEHLSVSLPARTLFATHYHELTQLAEAFPRMSNANVLVREWGDEIVFLHQVVPGATDRSYGIHVARLAGIPEPILNKAEHLLLELRPEDFWEKPTASQEYEMDLFAPKPSKIHEMLKGLEINRLTPLEALKILDELCQEAQND